MADEHAKIAIWDHQVHVIFPILAAGVSRPRSGEGPLARRAKDRGIQWGCGGGSAA